jgi:hypothetical protein
MEPFDQLRRRAEEQRVRAERYRVEMLNNGLINTIEQLYATQSSFHVSLDPPAALALCETAEELRGRLERAETERDEARAELCREIDRGDGLFHEAAVYKAEREEARRVIEDALFLFGARSRNENLPEVTLDGWTKSAHAALGAAGERGGDAH